MKRHVLILIALFLFAFLLYGKALQGPFIFDDYDAVVNNHGIKAFPDLQEIWKGNKSFSKLKYLTSITFGANYYFSGINPFGYHLTNLFIHIVNAFLVYLLVFMWMGVSPGSVLKDMKTRWPFSALTALIFFIHPAQTQAVNYIWARSELLTALFGSASLLFYTRGRLAKNSLYFIFAGFLYMAGLFARGTLIILPALIVLIEILFFRAPASTFKVFIKNHFIAVCTCGAGLFFIGLFFKPIVMFLDIPWAFYHPRISSLHYFLTELRAIKQYLFIFVYPAYQNFDYHFPLSRSLLERDVYMSCMVIFAVLISGILIYRRKPLLSFGIFWFFIAILPTSSIFPLSTHISESRIYWPFFGFAVLTSALVFTVIQNPRARIDLSVLMLVALCVFTYQRNLTWQSAERLLEDTIRKSPLNARPYVMLGALHLRAGNLPQALELTQKALSLVPTYSHARNNLGLIYLRQNDWDYAESEFRRAIIPGEYYCDPMINLGYLFAQKMEWAEAQKFFREGLRCGPSDAAYLGLGLVDSHVGDVEAAVNNFRKAIEINPDNATAHFNIGNIFFGRGDYETAILSYSRAVEKDAMFADAYVNGGLAYYQKKDFREAIRKFEHARQINPFRKDIYLDLANAYYEIGQKQKADYYFQQYKKLSSEGNFTPLPAINASILSP